jgi:hypothetical protein
MSNEPITNHGEGNPEAADEFNTAEQRFINSERGKKRIQDGPKVKPEEEADLARAEHLGRERAKADDSATTMARPSDDN